MKKDLISIIVPVYNCEKYIGQTIESVKNQTYQNFELLIVNDCSTDNSLEEIKNATKNIQDKAKIFNLPQNSGVATARNFALEHAQGEFIAYLDGDDLWEKEKLEKELKFIREKDIAFAYTNFKYLRQNGFKKVRLFPTKFNYKKALKNTIILTSTVMFDMKKIDKSLLKMPNIKRGQDAATWWNILKNGYMAYGLNEYLTVYRRRTDSLSFNKSSAMKRTWNLYRNMENLGFIKALYYWNCYAVNAAMRRIF